MVMILLKGNAVKKWVKCLNVVLEVKISFKKIVKKCTLRFAMRTFSDVFPICFSLLHTFTWLFGRMTQWTKVLYPLSESWKFKPNQVLGQQLR